jgi:enterochelin esterase-like enzyme
VLLQFSLAQLYTRSNAGKNHAMTTRVQGSFVTFTAPDGAHALIGDFTDGTDRPIKLEAGQSVTLEFPRAAYIEYAFLDAKGAPFADPDNPLKAQNPWYAYFRAVMMPRYRPHELREALPDAPKGQIERLEWNGKIFAGKRRAYVYKPPSFDSSIQYPVFFVQDGVAYYRTGKLNLVADNLLHLGRIQPVVLVFLEPADRTEEYFFNDAHLEFLITEAVTQIESRYPISRDMSKRGLWGASLGGLASMYAAFTRPDAFGNVVTQSGAFQGKPGTPYQRIPAEYVRKDGQNTNEWLLEQVTSTEKRNLRISQECGQLEWLLGANRRMAAALWDEGYAHQYVERASGHNWVTWRDGLADHLEFMLGT